MDVEAFLLAHAPDSAFPGPKERTVKMVAALCPLEAMAALPYDNLVNKLREIRFEMKPSTPYDDDTYWAAWSPFDHRFYVFAGGLGGGWPTAPDYVLSERPQWLDLD
jgi:hypothetical protein